MSAPSATAAFTFADRHAVVIDRALYFLTHRNRNGEADFCNAKIERYLAMPELLQQLGLGERAKKKSLCPFHHDQHASFSVWQRNGSWFWKCHAGCGAGDEINFLEKYKDISRGQAIALYHEMAGVRSSSPTPQRKSSNGSKPIDWQQCVNALKPAELVRLGNERWYSRAFCSWLHSRKLIGLHGGDFAFPVGRNEAVVGAHYRVEDGSWRYHPQGTKTALFIVGNLATAKHVHASESQWDLLAVVDRTDLYRSEDVAFVATRGASNPKLLANLLLRKDATIYLWPQNDGSGQKWLEDVRKILPAAHTVKIPGQFKDANEWTAASPEDGGGFKDGLLDAAAQSIAKLINSTPDRDNNELSEQNAAVRGEIVRILTNSKLSAFEQREAISRVVVPALRSRGRFFYRTDRRDLESVMFFDNDRKQLERINSDWFQVWLSNWLSINRVEAPFKAAASAVESAALTESLSTGIIPELFWASRRGAFYLSNGDGALVKITAGNVQLIDNGTDGVLFARASTLAPWKLTNPQDPFQTCSLFKNANCAAGHGLDLLRLWIFSLPTNPANKPPACLTGEVRSGKTRLAKGIAELYGVSARVSNIEDFSDDDFWVSVDGGGLFTLDNCDTSVKWLADAVAAAATDGCREGRKLYTDSERITLRARAWICLTTANPTFASDAGLADRLLVVRMNRRTDETDDSKLSDEITEHRDAALSFIAQTLSRALADNKPVPAGLNLRHPDFARFAVKIGRAIGREEQIVSALQIAEKDKSLFCLENDFIGAAVLDYLDETGTFTGTAAELRTKLSERDLGFIRKDRPSAKGVGKRLRTLWPHFENILTVARQEEDRNHFKIYTLKSKSADFADFV